MLVSFANNQTMVADQDGGPAVITTDPLPVGDANNVYFVMNIHHLQAMGSPPAPDVAFVMQYSNDGQVWVPTTTGLSASATGPAHTEGPISAVFVRLEITHNTNGSSGDWSAATFDIHGNLKHI